jgi:hypothetical protein
MSPTVRRILIAVAAFVVAYIIALVIGGSITPTAVLALFVVLAAVGIGIDVLRTRRDTHGSLSGE